MASFATVAELADYLQTTIAAGTQTTAAQMALDAATQAIKSYTRQDIEAVGDDTYTVVYARPSGSTWPYTSTLFLPQLPVNDVSEVEIAGTALGADYWVWEANGILHRTDGSYFDTGASPVTVNVTYSHGYSPIPADVKQVCLQMAATQYQYSTAAGTEEGVGYSIGNYSQNAVSGAQSPITEHAPTLDRYRVLIMA